MVNEVKFRFKDMLHECRKISFRSLPVIVSNWLSSNERDKLELLRF